MIPVYDIESVNWVTPVAVGFFDGTDYYDFVLEREDDDIVWRFLCFLSQYDGIRIFAHNAANYDNKFILDCLYRHDQTIRFAAGMGKLVWVEHDISFEDSYLMIGRGLDKCCEMFGVEKKLYWDHKETKNPWEMKARLDSFRRYLKRDCISLSKVIEEFSRIMLENFGVGPSATLSLTSVKAFDKKFYSLKNIHSNEQVEKFIRAATYGGRNEVYRRFGTRLYLYDIRSMYTSCYDNPVPVGKMYWTNPNMDKGSIAEAVVKVPTDMFIGPLPYRFRGRLIFPVGEFKGWWDMAELRFAARLGVDITLTRQLECDELPILKEFGLHVSELRKQYPKQNELWKLFGLRLSGKLGQQRWRSEVKHARDLEEDCTGWWPLDRSEVYHERRRYMKGNTSPYVKPAVNMRVRAVARIRHLEKLLEAEDVYYCDTDSVYTTTKMKEGRDAGGLQLQDLAVRAYFIRCKLYGYSTARGTFVQRSSGFKDYKLTESDFKHLLEGGQLQSTHVFTTHWKKIVGGSGVELVDKGRTIQGYLEFENRIPNGIDTEPIRLPLQKGDIYDEQQ